MTFFQGKNMNRNKNKNRKSYTNAISNLTKAIEQVQRIACALHVLKIVSKKLFDLGVKHQYSFSQLNEKFKEIVINESLNDDDLSIDLDTCVNAKNITDYYLRIKKILAGYDPIKNKVYVETPGEMY